MKIILYNEQAKCSKCETRNYKFENNECDILWIDAATYNKEELMCDNCFNDTK
jgi:hypothetical protein